MISVIMILLGGALFMQCEKDLDNTALNFRNDICLCLDENYPVEALSDFEIDGLLLMREEEKLARDVYLGLLEKWDSHVFSNISNSEQRHMDMMLCLINKYELDDPADQNEIGDFENKDLQALYDALMAKGNESLIDAYEVGATIEDLDIYDLMNLSEKANNEDILAVFSEMTRASRNHMRAFTKNLNILDETYVAQYIEEDLLQEIIDSPKEKGGAICGGCDAESKCNKNKNKNGKNKNCVNNEAGNQGNKANCTQDKTNCKDSSKACSNKNNSKGNNSNRKN